MELSDPRVGILSQPLKIHWAGWKSDTLTLQQAGWQLSAEQDVMRYGMRIALRHRALDCIAVTDTVDDFPYRARDLRRMNILPELHVRYFGCRLQIQMHQMGAMNFQPIDAAPQFIHDFQIKDAADLNWFAAPLVRTEEIVVEQATVADMLAQIRSMQKDEQATIRHRQRLRERRDGMSMDGTPREVFHAQVISLAA